MKELFETKRKVCSVNVDRKNISVDYVKQPILLKIQRTRGLYLTLLSSDVRLSNERLRKLKIFSSTLTNLVKRLRSGTINKIDRGYTRTAIFTTCKRDHLQCDAADWRSRGATRKTALSFREVGSDASGTCYFSLSFHSFLTLHAVYFNLVFLNTREKLRKFAYFVAKRAIKFDCEFRIYFVQSQD